MHVKRILTIMLFLIACQFGHSQVDVSFTLNFDTVKTDQFRFVNHGKSQTDLRMSYASHKIVNPTNTEMFHGKEVTSISLIYTDHPKSINLAVLNQRRVEMLYKLKPELFNNSNIKWNLVKQTGCTDITCYDFFHGFAINYRDSVSSFTENTEMREMREIVDGDSPKDSTIYKVMERNKDWCNMLVISDLTASMSPYVAELLLWFKLNNNDKKVRSFVFFNDGDLKRTAQKEIGNTGGIYMGEADDLEKILNIAFRTMAKGYGGDLPENDVEAIMEGIGSFTKFDEVVLIADNKSEVRDLELAEKLKIPIKVVLCGTEKGVLIDYLELAYKSGGSVHTIEEDITSLMKLNDGETVEIGNVKYVIQNGKFSRLTKN